MYNPSGAIEFSAKLQLSICIVMIKWTGRMFCTAFTSGHLLLVFIQVGRSKS